MPYRVTIAVAFLFGCAANGLATEPNDSFVAATSLPPNTFSIADELTLPSIPDTLIGIKDSTGEIYLTDDDGSPIGDGRASGLAEVLTNADAIHFSVSGFDDQIENGVFTEVHNEQGDYEVFVQVYDSMGVPFEQISHSQTLELNSAHDFTYSNPAWNGGKYDVYIDNTVGHADVDFFTFIELEPGANFEVRTLDALETGIDTLLGWFDDFGELIALDNDGGGGMLSFLQGVVPESGDLTVAVSGSGDDEFSGSHISSGSYELTLELTEPDDSLPGDLNFDGYVDAADYVVWCKLGGLEPGYETWYMNFGRTSEVSPEKLSSAQAGSQVPEPPAVVLILIPIAAVLLSLGRRGPRACRWPARVTQSRSRQCDRVAFSLVELLVVMAIIAIIAALLLPAIQAARESARRAQCQNNMKQIGLGLLNYHDTYKTFPHGGWGHLWVGVPEQGIGKDQPGGWVFSLLPFLELQDLRELGISQEASEANLSYSTRLRTTIELFTCPSRRPCRAWPVSDKYGYVKSPRPYGEVLEVARSDYAINGGASNVISHGGPADLKQGKDELYWLTATSSRKCTGISHLRTAVRLRAITDGTSKTYLAGEKYVESSSYETGESLGDNESMYSGYCTDLHRFTGAIERAALSLSPVAPPVADTEVVVDSLPGHARFGSSHPGGLNMLNTDGSVSSLSYEVDPEVHFRFGHRFDGNADFAALLRSY